jgi:hypothetical protein
VSPNADALEFFTYPERPSCRWAWRLRRRALLGEQRVPDLVDRWLGRDDVALGFQGNFGNHGERGGVDQFGDLGSDKHTYSLPDYGLTAEQVKERFKGL